MFAVIIFQRGCGEEKNRMDAKERRLVDLLWRKTSLLSSEGICFLYEARGLGGQWVADGQSQRVIPSASPCRV